MRKLIITCVRVLGHLIKGYNRAYWEFVAFLALFFRAAHPPTHPPKKTTHFATWLLAMHSYTLQCKKEAISFCTPPPPHNRTWLKSSLEKMRCCRVVCGERLTRDRVVLSSNPNSDYIADFKINNNDKNTLVK